MEGALATRPVEAPALRRMQIRTRATPDAGEGTFEALVSDYTQTYDIGWGWRERILPGAFADSIAAHPVISVNWEHNWRGGPIGHCTPEEFELGLLIRGEMYLDLDPLVQRIWRSMMAGATNEWSIGFGCSWDDILNTDDEPYVDQIVRGDLIEASACYRGANTATATLDLRKLVAIDGDAHAEVVRLRSAFGRPATRSAGKPVTTPPATVEPEAVGRRALIVGCLRTRSEDGTLADIAEQLDDLADDLLEVLGLPDVDDPEDEVPEPAEGDAMAAAEALLSAERAQTAIRRRVLATRSGSRFVAARAATASSTAPSDPQADPEGNPSA